MVKTVVEAVLACYWPLTSPILQIARIHAIFHSHPSRRYSAIFKSFALFCYRCESAKSSAIAGCPALEALYASVYQGEKVSYSSLGRLLHVHWTTTPCVEVCALPHSIVLPHWTLGYNRSQSLRSRCIIASRIRIRINTSDLESFLSVCLNFNIMNGKIVFYSFKGKRCNYIICSFLILVKSGPDPSQPILGSGSEFYIRICHTCCNRGSETSSEWLFAVQKDLFSLLRAYISKS